MGTYEREAVEKRLHDRLDELVRELAEANRKLDTANRLIASFREAAQRTRCALNRLDELLTGKGLRPVPRNDSEGGMAVWMDRPTDSTRR